MARKKRLGPYGFKISSIDKLPVHVIGVYAFWYRNCCIYIGQAKDQGVKDRLWQHYTRCHNPGLKMWIDAYHRDLHFCVFEVTRGKIDALERKLIKRHQPRTNVMLK
jgi:excinuclease UvrABC nuclease subunit